MKSTIREFLTDIKAASRIGHPESIDSAMDGLAAFKEVTGNQVLDEAFIHQLVIPTAQILARSSVTSRNLLELSEDQNAAIRAIYAGALGFRASDDPEITPQSLRKLGNDKRFDVRFSLSIALKESGAEEIIPLAREWVTSDSVRLQETGINAIPVAEDMDIISTLEILSKVKSTSDYKIRKALAEKFIEIANNTTHGPQVKELLDEWSREPEPNTWLIDRIKKFAFASDDPAETSE